ncbi:BaiN/RdsA family NAD(P)/FAD-dependent oxidoreductase [Planktothrix mougeotii]|uniref:NAD(P)/FAD-dependent oxidoreductase n=1 Tax=Planktothrix mougeotii LEGE 06226 TaxID=1828728 RepID=A0ABR9U8A9_9CYAN|nr:NAD(P)/FAD-dependent oxidoreductase [Planktothrix mougeotii]MBE9142436.1 NAD(P)/FAD-dependent oxidoreductase [Planktothrix mougeotii LEGE 06226]
MSSLHPVKVIVIGGGAAGFFGAITCATYHPHTQVILLEAGQQPLAKVRISGGGRCNVTHACFEPTQFVQNYPRGSKALRGAFSRFQAKNTVEWFTRQGVQLKTESDGRMFPTTDDSATIVNCLMRVAEQAGVRIKTQVPVTAISHHNSNTYPFKIQLKTGEILESDRLLLATGNNPSGYRFAQALGHTIIPPVPSLFTFNIKDQRLQDLAGVSVSSVRVKLPQAKLEQTGPLLITHWGLSGPAILKLSAWGARVLYDCGYKSPLQINWLPQEHPEQLKEQLLGLKSEFPKRLIAANCPVDLPRRLWKQLVNYIGIDEEKRWSEISNKSLNQLIQELTQGSYKITGKGVFKEEFVTCGGVNLKEVDFKTMESRCCPGLYLAGEVLDIDGITGGFNFQSAWTTGWLAGQSIGKLKDI